MRELVALDLAGGPDFVRALRAVWDEGDAAAPLDARLPPAARQAQLDALQPSAILDARGDRTRLAGGRPVDDGDALVICTSGSTGQPKAVILTHDAVVASARATSARLGVDPQRHHWLACLPLAHVGGLSVITRAMTTGTALTVLPGFDASAVERAATEGGVTHVSLVATALGRIDPARFTLVLLGGAAPPEHLADNVVTTYGLTETGSGVIYDGLALDGVDVAIGSGDPDTGRPGEILVRGPMLLRCYRDGTDPRIPGPDGSGAWLPTGDGGYEGADGRLVVLGRLDEVIVTGGEKVWPAAVERVLARLPSVGAVAVWKRPDREWGERVVAWVVPAGGAPGPELGELHDAVVAELAPWAAPKELVLVDTLPRTTSGKVRRTELP